MINFNLPALGGGAGLRSEHFEEILSTRPPFNWFEIINENYLDFGGAKREELQEISRRYQLIGHGVCLSIGSTDPLDISYLKRLKPFLDEIKSPWTSDHLCFTMVDHTNLNDLIPIPFTKESANNCIERLKTTQDILERPFLIENVTRYMTVSDREMSESEFITTVLLGANCGLLLDVTNVYLNSQCHRFDPWKFITSLPMERIGQVHLAGWSDSRTEIEKFTGDEFSPIIDTHDAPVPPPVWSLFQKLIEVIGPTSALVEWDSELPSLNRLLLETQIANKVMEKHESSDRTMSRGNLETVNLGSVNLGSGEQLVSNGGGQDAASVSTISS